MASPAPVTLSWAEVLLMLLLVLGGWGTWTMGVRYLGGQPAAETASKADTNGDTRLLQTRTESDRLREALLKEKLEVARTQAQLAWLQGLYSGLAPNPPAGVSPVPEDARTGHDLAVRNLYVSRQLISAIEASLASADIELNTQQTSRDAAAVKKAKDTASSKQANLWRVRGLSAGLVASLVVAFSVMLWFKKAPPKTIHSGRIIGVSVASLLVLITYDVFGAPALMLASVVLGLLVVRAATVTS